MKNKIVKLCKQLIAVSSTSENQQSLKKVIELAKKELQGYTIEDFEKNSIPSVLVYNTKKKAEEIQNNS